MAKVNHKSWFRWLKSRQVDKIRAQGIARLSSTHQEYRSLIDTGEVDSRSGDAIPNEVVEDAILVETNRGKAEQLSEKIIDNMHTYFDLTKKDEAVIQQMRIHAGVSNAFVLVLTSLILYLHTKGQSNMICDEMLSRYTPWLVLMGYIVALSGYLTVGKRNQGEKNNLYANVLDDSQMILRLLQLEDDTSTDIGNTLDVESIEDYSLVPEEWYEPSAAGFQVRGETYLHNAKKVKSPAVQFKLLGVDLVESSSNIKNIAVNPKNRVARALLKGDKTFYFVFNFMIPGPPHLSFVAYWELDKEKVYADTPFGRVAKPFFFGDDDDFRNARLKVLPVVAEGNFAVKMAIQNKPTLMGQKLDHFYYRGDNYFELDVDISGRPVARNLTGICVGYAKNMILEMALILQGEQETELPESVMATVAVSHADVVFAKEM